MKLSDHVDKIRNLITASFDKQFARLGIGANKQIELEKLPEQVRDKRKHLEVMLENHIGETGCYQDAREKLLDELSFTLFNRLAAVKVMESANLFPPVITKQAEHGGRSFGHKAWLEEYPEKRESELEGIRDYFKHAFNELGDSLPLYGKEYPYALLPDAISLNEIIEAFNAIEEDSQVEDDIWKSDDVLGWLYESYNNAKKQAFKDSKAKTEYDKVSLQSQVYTPRWVVQFLVENSLGKLYLEMYPESDIKNQFKIANAPKTQERKPKPLHEIKLIDPASGSGNFLLYAFDFFYALYIDQIENYDADYDEDDIPKHIIENNLHGIDLDDRAIQLAQLGLYIKARKKRRFIKGSFNFKVVSSDFYLPAYNEARHIFEESGNLDSTQKELIEDIWNDLRYAYKFGSLIRLDEKLKAKLKELESKQGDKILDLFADADIREQKDFTELFLSNLKAAVEKFASKDADTFIASKTLDAIIFLELLTNEYSVINANPPYTDSSDFGKELKCFIDVNFKKPHKFHTNLYSVFIKRCFELAEHGGKIALIHPDTFMFLKTFEGVRTFLLNNSHINVFSHYPQTGGVFGIGIIYPAFYVLEKDVNKKGSSIFINVADSGGRVNEITNFKNRLSDCINDVENKHVYRIQQDKLSVIKSYPFIYWISDEFREKFGQTTLEKVAHISEGFKSNDNLKILRYHWEIKYPFIEGDGYQLYTKGGDFNKWYGNNWLSLKWDNDGENQIKSGADLTAKDYYFCKGITYSKASNRGNSFRLLDENVIFDSASPSLFSKSNKFNLFGSLALLNSKLGQTILRSLNPSVSSQVGDIKRVPISKSKNKETIELLVSNIVSCKKVLNSFSLIEPNYCMNPLLKYNDSSLKNRIGNFLNYDNYLTSGILINEAIINTCIFSDYELTDEDINMVLSKEGKIIGSLPIFPEAKKAYLEEINSELLPITKEFVKNLPETTFSYEKIESLSEDFQSLYKKNNDLEAFCINHELNPINVWYLFSKDKCIPKHRMQQLVMEFLADIIREILQEDSDGIIPLVKNSSESTLIERLEIKLTNKGFSSAQFASLDVLIGKSLKDYLQKLFFKTFSDYLNLFQYLPKTPFIWHLSSGSEQGFDCYISIYQWSRDNLMRIRSVYIEHRERALINRQSDLANNESVDAQNEKDKISKQLKEIESFKVKIDELLEEGYNPTIDDGVGKNIAPLQTKKMLAYDVLNAGQIKKYLNADW